MAGLIPHAEGVEAGRWHWKVEQSFIRVLRHGRLHVDGTTSNATSTRMTASLRA